MKNKKTILIAGGDMRQVYCAKKLSAAFDTSITGFDSDLVSGLDQTADRIFDYAVLPVPALDNEGNISTPCFEGCISPADISRALSKNAVIFAGRVDDELRRNFPFNELIDYMSREELSLKNAVPTAEGAVQIALSELPVTLNGLSVLIVGMGRIGTALAEILKGFGADITVAVRNAKGAATARIHGLRSVCSDRMTTDHALVFNTVPAMLFDRELLSRFDKDTLFIDLASKPGGIDFDSASELGIRVIWALGLPGKTAPITSGEIIAETIEGILAERSDEHD